MITLTFSNLDAATAARIIAAASFNAEFRTAQQALRELTPEAAEPQTETLPEEDKPKRTRRTKAEIEAAKAQETKQPEKTEAAGELEPAAEALTFDDIRRAIQGVENAKGRDKAKAVIAEFDIHPGPGVKLSEALPKERYAEFAAACRQAVADE